MKRDFRTQVSLISVGTAHNKRVFLSRPARVRVILQLSFALVQPRDVINITLYRNPNLCARSERFRSRKEVNTAGYENESLSMRGERMQCFNRRYQLIDRMQNILRNYKYLRESVIVEKNYNLYNPFHKDCFEILELGA